MKQTNCFLSWNLGSSEEGDSELQDNRSVNNYGKNVEKNEAGYVGGAVLNRAIRKRAYQDDLWTDVKE